MTVTISWPHVDALKRFRRGRQEFIKRSGEFAVMIGLCFKGEPVLGVVHAPAQDVPKTHYAVAGQGAFVLTGDACGEGLAGSERLRCGFACSPGDWALVPCFRCLTNDRCTAPLSGTRASYFSISARGGTNIKRSLRSEKIKVGNTCTSTPV